MQRTCPSCKADIEGTGEYFCLNCGFKLPDELISLDVRSQKLKLDPPPFDVREEISSSAVLGLKKFVIPVVSICLLVTALGYIYYYYTSNLNKIKVSTSSVNIKEERVLNLPDLDVPVTKFVNQGLAEHVPYDSDILVQGKDLLKLLSLVVDVKKLSETLGGKVNFNDIDAISNNDYIIFSKPEATSSARLWGIAAKIDNESAAEKLISDTKEATWSAIRVDDYIIFSNSRGLESEVKDAKKKIKLNITLNPRFALAKNSVVTEGKLLVVILNDSAKSIVNSMKEDFFLQNFILMKDKVLGKEKNSVVIN